MYGRPGFSVAPPTLATHTYLGCQFAQAAVARPGAPEPHTPTRTPQGLLGRTGAPRLGRERRVAPAKSYTGGEETGARPVPQALRGLVLLGKLRKYRVELGIMRTTHVVRELVKHAR